MNWLQDGGMRSSGQVTQITSMQVRRCGGSVVQNRLLRMLASTSQRFPMASIAKRRGAYGVSMHDGGYLRVSYSEGLTAGQQRDLLALFVTWLVVDQSALLNQNTPLDGSS
jgi:hypothetical protein